MDLRIGVMGATGAVGKEIVAVLNRTRWRPATLVAAASPSTETSLIEYGDDTIPVEDASMVDVDELDAVILATPASVARELGDRAVAAGVPVIDLSGAYADDEDVPLVVPWINPEVLAQDSLRGIVSVPNAPALLLLSALGPLVRAGVFGEVDATVMVPASLMGREGVAELSKQVVALFNSGTPPRKVFEYGLAFDLLPLLGEAEEDGWTALERTTIGQVRRVIGGEIPCGITLVGTSVFSGMAANVHLRTVKKIKKSRVERIFKDGGVQLSDKSVARYVPRPRRVEGQGLVHGGRIRTSADEVHLHFWLAMDNLRAAATVAVGCCAALLREQIEAGRREEHQEG